MKMLWRLLPLCLGLLPGLAVRAQEAPVKRMPYTIMAYSWTDVAPACDNIVSFGTRRLTLDNLKDPAGMKAVTDQMPEGRRVIFIWDVERDITSHPDDRCMDADGKPTAYPGIWLEHGVARVRERLDTFFRAYQALGGKLDMLLLDYEGGLSNWHLGSDPKRWKAIQDDPRFPEIVKELGFSDLTTVLEYWKQKGDAYNNFHRWNALMGARRAAYLHQAIYEPVKQYFPQVKMSNYGDHHYNATLGVPDGNGHRYYLFGTGTHVGTHQSSQLYTGLGQIDKRPPDGVAAYPHTRFNGFRHSLNIMRCMAGSSDVPIHPWISHRAFSEGYTASTNHDLYQEIIFHAGLCGSDEFLFWNPRPWQADQDPAGFTSDAQDKLFSDCLKELDKLIGYRDRKTLAKTLVPWGDDYALSGMRAGGRTVWRFTPKLEGEATLEDTLISDSPATFKVGDKIIIIPGGTLYRPEIALSTQGYWVLAPAQMDALPVVLGK